MTTFQGSCSYRNSLGFDSTPYFPNSHTGRPTSTPMEKKLAEARAGSGRHIFCNELTEPLQVQRALSHFDAVYQADLAREARALSDPAGTLVSDSALPASAIRAVIREALSDLRVLELVQVIVDPSMSATIQIPYESRLPGTTLNDGIVYEGQGIPRGSVRQDMDLAYVNAMKLSFLLSNEADFFSRNSQIDWSALDRLIATNAQIIRERIHMRICNELQRASDAFNAVAVVGEDISGQLTGSNSLIKTAHWPVVRPRQTRDLRGTAVGAEENSIALVVNGAAVAAFDGSGTQATGTYWVLENANLGFVRLVNQAGAAITPTASSACTLSYSAATNCAIFDLKLPAGVTLEQHMNGALRAIGAQKSTLFNKRFAVPDFLLTGPILGDLLTNATSFSINDRKAGTDLTKSGDLGVVRGMPAYASNAPGVDFGNERILIGERGALTYAIARPWATGEPFQAVDAAGRPTGERQAYGEEYNAIHVPAPIRYKLSSVICYDSDARAAAA